MAFFYISILIIATDFKFGAHIAYREYSSAELGHWGRKFVDNYE